MVSIDESYKDMTEEYTNLSQVWHDANEESEKDKLVIVEVVNTLTPKNEIGYYVEYIEYWVVNSMKSDIDFLWMIGSKSQIV